MRDRLEELLSLALAYRGWSVRHLAQQLDRCPTNLLPDSGLPKMDLVIRLADALDWPVETVIDHLSEQAFDPAPPDPPGLPATCADLLDAAAEALRSRDGLAVVRWARSASLLAEYRRDRVSACAMEADGWAMSGRWDRVVDCIQAVQPRVHDDRIVESEAESDAEVRPGLDADVDTDADVDVVRGNIGLLLRLARAYHRTGLWLEGSAVVRSLLDSCDGADAQTLAARAEGLLLRAFCFRDRHESLGDLPDREASSALADVEEAERLLKWPAVARFTPDASMLRLMASAIGLELRAALGRIGASAAVAAVLQGLEPWVDVEAAADRSALAGAGWWCVVGLSIASRSLTGASRQQMLAILSNKADEIAAAVDCWSLRERVLRLEVERRALAAQEGAEIGEWLLDEEDLRVIVGCIGASRRFRPLGLRILRNATLVQSCGQDLGRRSASRGAEER